MRVDFSDNYFQLFYLPVSFDINRKQLAEKFRELQSQLHPDKYASAADTERRWSMQAASFVNEGYQTLDNDLRRATYLLQLNGISIDEETDTQMAPEFLMEQMELRESLENVQSMSDPQDALDSIRSKLKSAVNVQVASFTKATDQTDWQSARTITRQWQFLDKLLREVKSVEEQLDI